MAEREIQPHQHRLAPAGNAARTHLGAHHIVDGGDMVRVHGMTQAEYPGEQGGAKQHRLAGEG